MSTTAIASCFLLVGHLWSNQADVNSDLAKSRSPHWSRIWIIYQLRCCLLDGTGRVGWCKGKSLLALSVQSPSEISLYCTSIMTHSSNASSFGISIPSINHYALSSVVECWLLHKNESETVRSIDFELEISDNIHIIRSWNDECYLFQGGYIDALTVTFFREWRFFIAEQRVDSQSSDMDKSIRRIGRTDDLYLYHRRSQFNQREVFEASARRFSLRGGKRPLYLVNI